MYTLKPFYQFCDSCKIPPWAIYFKETNIKFFTCLHGFIRILQSDWFREGAVFSYLLTTGMVTNYAKRKVKLRIERAKFQFVLIIFRNRAVLLFNFLIKHQWILNSVFSFYCTFVDTLMRQCVK